MGRSSISYVPTNDHKRALRTKNIGAVVYEHLPPIMRFSIATVRTMHSSS